MNPYEPVLKRLDEWYAKKIKDVVITDEKKFLEEQFLKSFSQYHTKRRPDPSRKLNTLECLDVVVSMAHSDNYFSELYKDFESVLTYIDSKIKDGKISQAIYAEYYHPVIKQSDLFRNFMILAEHSNRHSKPQLSDIQINWMLRELFIDGQNFFNFAKDTANGTLILWDFHKKEDVYGGNLYCMFEDYMQHSESTLNGIMARAFSNI